MEVIFGGVDTWGHKVILTWVLRRILWNKVNQWNELLRRRRNYHLSAFYLNMFQRSKRQANFSPLSTWNLHQWLPSLQSSPRSLYSFSFSPSPPKPISPFQRGISPSSQLISTIFFPFTVFQSVSYPTMSSPTFSPTTVASKSNSKAIAMSNSLIWSTTEGISRANWAMGLWPMFLGFKWRSSSRGSLLLESRLIKALIPLSLRLGSCLRLCRPTCSTAFLHVEGRLA